MEIKCDELWFWGKILGLEKDYFICLAVFYEGNFQFPQKKYFFCNSVSYIFTELPEIGQDQIQDALKFNTYFVGNPDIILEKYVENSEGETYLNIPNSFNKFNYRNYNQFAKFMGKVISNKTKYIIICLYKIQSLLI